MAVKKSRKFLSFVIYSFLKKESAFTAAKRNAKFSTLM